MAQEHINTGTPNGNDGDFLRDGFIKVENNTTELYNNVATNASNISTNSSDIISHNDRITDNELNIQDLSDAQTGGLKSFLTLTLLQAYATPDINDSYKVTNDPTPANNGFYHWVSGTTYVKDESPYITQTLEPTNTTEAPSNKAVADYIESFKPIEGTHEIELTFNVDEVIEHTQTSAINYTLATTGNELLIGKRIRVIGNGDGITFGFNIGTQQGVVSASKLNYIYLLYVGNDTVDIRVINEDTILTDTDNLQLLYEFDEPSKLTVDGSNNLLTVIDQSPLGNDASVTGTIPYDLSSKNVEIGGASSVLRELDFSEFQISTINTTIVIVGKFYNDIANYNIFAYLLNGFLIRDNSGFQDLYFGRGVYENSTQDKRPVIQGDGVLIISSKNNDLKVFWNNELISSDTRATIETTKTLSHINQSSTADKPVFKLNEFRVINKVYPDEQMELLYNAMVSKYSINTTDFPTLSNVTLSGTPTVGSTLTVNFDYNQNGAGLQGDYFVEWKYRAAIYNNPLTGTVIDVVKNNNTIVVPSISGNQVACRIIMLDENGLASGEWYESDILLIS